MFKKRIRLDVGVIINMLVLTNFKTWAISGEKKRGKEISRVYMFKAIVEIKKKQSEDNEMEIGEEMDT